MKTRKQKPLTQFAIFGREVQRVYTNFTKANPPAQHFDLLRVEYAFADTGDPTSSYLRADEVFSNDPRFKPHGPTMCRLKALISQCPMAPETKHEIRAFIKAATLA